ncbi:uncharacterized protein YbjT (DUF2867 family) [Paraburkholderia sp. RAU2J]|uniref:NmrA family NAD(P)-binding protein n=1 Tax=Paraburkholderia sp. RAU2J TaxID=1938810 RepID=UPI000EB3AA00|nr:NmrA family NAD(P)-binding protein [Paraburkholderia sp. RAU2J]RKT14239.1 uncharacterized protein YbjT (DUF2867 family) [Paraburkholderia sp. RAU2J]
MTQPSGTVLVIGATGAQGGATARHLLARGFRVQFLTRDPESAAARALEAAGAYAFKGDLDDTHSLVVALQGVNAVFSVQLPSVKGEDSERRHGFALINASRAAGVAQFVHTSVAQSGNHTSFPGWNRNRWSTRYWTDKWDVENAVRNAGFANWTVLRPAFMMDNLALPKATSMFPHLQTGELLSALLPQTKLHFVAADDVGTFAAASMVDPLRFHEQTIPLASEAPTMSQVAATLSAVLRTSIKAVHVGPQEAIARGLFPAWVNAQEWINEVGYFVDIDKVASYGLPLTSLREWAQKHHNRLPTNNTPLHEYLDETGQKSWSAEPPTPRFVSKANQ